LGGAPKGAEKPGKGSTAGPFKKTQKKAGLKKGENPLKEGKTPGGL